MWLISLDLYGVTKINFLNSLGKLVANYDFKASYLAHNQLMI